MTSALGDAVVSCALVCCKTGVVLASSEAGLDPRLELLAATATELLQVDSSIDFASLFAELEPRGGTANFQELVVISPARVHVLSRPRTRPDAALVATIEHTQKLGLLLSTVRARLAQLEASA
jgi:hypothetical protein